MIVLGIETSCDETSAAVLDGGRVRSNIISSQHVHRKYGGVVPELASRAHQQLIIQVVDESLAAAGISKEQVQGVASTFGPGLAGALLVGLTFGKALAYGLRIPFVGVNHMEGHLYSPFLGEETPAYPFLSLVVSGGHTMLVEVSAPFQHRLLGQTRDDAAGEAFDKVAKMLGLGYPGGPVIDRLARSGDRHAVEFPRSFLAKGSYDFSFSGIKTAVLYHLRDRGISPGETQKLSEKELADLCASFQAAVVDVLTAKTLAAAAELGLRDITMAGGVSANSELRERLGAGARAGGHRLFFPELQYCMDNGAMIALVGRMRMERSERSPLTLNVDPNLTL
jgi:N6-L-threonylcarbamoyladenine synthase